MRSKNENGLSAGTQRPAKMKKTYFINNDIKLTVPGQILPKQDPSYIPKCAGHEDMVYDACEGYYDEVGGL